jgi:hypothetical protein
MRALFRCSPAQDDPNNTPITALLASAICNSSRSTAARCRSTRIGTPLIAHRIRNCLTIASYLNPLEGSCYIAGPEARHKALMLDFCSAASTSTYCQEYMYMPLDYWQWFGTYGEGDVTLEVALLVACGYSTEQVLKIMPQLAKEGKLAPYSRNGATGGANCRKRRKDLVHDGTCISYGMAYERATVVNELCERGRSEYYRSVLRTMVAD